MATKDFGNGIYEVQARVGLADLEAQLAWVSGADVSGTDEEDAKEGVENLISALIDACEGRQDIHRKVIELETRDDGTALLFDPGAPQPYIVASGYDPASKGWSSGRYRNDLRDAAQELRFGQSAG